MCRQLPLLRQSYSYRENDLDGRWVGMGLEMGNYTRVTALTRKHEEHKTQRTIKLHCIE